MSADLKSKKKNVQFDVVNTTSNPIILNLFEQGITTTPTTDSTVSSPPLILTGATIGFSETAWFERNTNTNEFYYFRKTGINCSVDVYLADNTFVTNIPIAGNCYAGGTFCPTQNKLYIPDFSGRNVAIIDTTTNTVIANPTIIGVGFQLRNCLYIPSTDEVWVLTTDPAIPCQILNVVTDTLGGTPVLPACTPEGICYYAPLDLIYIACNSISAIWKIDPNTQTLLLQTATAMANPVSCGVVNDEIWIGGRNTNRFIIYDTATDVTTNKTLPAIGSIYRGNWLYVDYWDRVYAYDSLNGFVYGIDSSGVVQEQLVAGATARGIVAIPVGTTTLFGYGGFNLYTYQGTVISNPIYVSGSADYNFFVNSLEGQPIKLDCVDIITTTQDQLSNAITVRNRHMLRIVSYRLIWRFLLELFTIVFSSVRVLPYLNRNFILTGTRSYITYYGRS